MKDTRIEKLADILVEYSVGVKKDDLVVIRGSYVAEPLILAIYERCLEAGAQPMIQASIPRAQPTFFRVAQEHQLDFVWETDKWLYGNVDCMFSILSNENTRQLSRSDPAKQRRVQMTRKPLMDDFFTRAAEGNLRWNVTLFPTEAYAQEAGMSLEEYENFYFEACLVDSPDPVDAWKKTAERHARLIEWMKGRNEVHIEGEGTDLILEVGGRIFLPADGNENFPDGEIFTGPIEDKTRGHISFSFPAIYRGSAVEDIRLEFENGKVVDARAGKNEKFLIETLDTDEGSRTLGELGIGTNYGIQEFTGEILLDEKIGGTVHLALGASYPESGGLNDSAIHWDMVCDLRKGGRITVDGDVLMEDGKLLV
ncbi:MAG: aminopeptidase [Actinomycetota bacterium]|nr:aminopeptidase [Actinomycetota bacterium]